MIIQKTFRDFFRPTWKKMLIVLISYPFLVGPAIGVFWLVVRNFAGDIFFNVTLPVFFSAIFTLLLYFVSCLLVLIFSFRKEEVTGVTYWENGMFVGMLVAILLVIIGTSPFISSTEYLNLNFFITFASLIFYSLSFLPINIFNSFNEIIKTISCWSDAPSCGAEGGLWFIFEYYGIITPIISGIVMGGLIGFICSLFKRKKRISEQAESGILFEQKEVVIRWPVFSYLSVLGIAILALGIVIWWSWPREVKMESQASNFILRAGHDVIGETEIGDTTNGCSRYPGPVFSPDGFHFACGDDYVQEFWKKSQNKLSTMAPQSILILDGQIIATYGLSGVEKYENISSLVFSPNSKHFVYKAVTSKGHIEFIVMDGREEKKYNFIKSYQFAFSQNGEHYTYSAHSSDDKEYVIVNGREIAEYDDIYADPVLSSDGKRLAYAYGVGRPPNPNLVVDGQEKGSFDYLRYITFSPNGERLAFMTSTGKGKYYIKVDNRTGKEYDAIAKPIFSPDSKHLAYVAKEGNKILVVLDDEIKKEFESAEFLTMESGLEQTDYLIFSPDSQHLAYIVQTVSKNGFDYKRKQFVFLDGENKYEYEIIPYKEMDSLAFSPDSKHLLFRVAGGNIIVDSKNFGEKYDNVYNPHFSLDGNYIIYNAQKDKIFYRVVEKNQ